MGNTIILLVDDSSMIRHVVGKILKDLGHKVVIARDGREGVALARTQKPKLIIMDVEMPVLDGIQATERIKADPETTHIPVIIFTSLGGEEDLRRARNAGCDGFLNKPVSKEDIQAEVQRLLASAP